jgi:hypothetical protein
MASSTVMSVGVTSSALTITKNIRKHDHNIIYYYDPEKKYTGKGDSHDDRKMKVFYPRKEV